MRKSAENFQNDIFFLDLTIEESTGVLTWLHCKIMISELKTTLVKVDICVLGRVRKK